MSDPRNDDSFDVLDNAAREEEENTTTPPPGLNALAEAAAVRALQQLLQSAGGTPPGGSPGGAGSSAANPLFMETPKKISKVINPYGNFNDMEGKEKKANFEKLAEADDDWEKVDVTVANSKLLWDLFKDKSITYRWRKYSNIPTQGDGTINATESTSASGKTRIMNADLKEMVSMIDDPAHVTMDHVKSRTAWFMGGDSQKLVAHKKPEDMLMEDLDLEASGNLGLVNKFKQQCRVVSQIIWATIKNHVSDKSYKSLLVHQHQFVFTDAETEDQYYDGFIMLKMVLDIIKPDVAVDVKLIENKLKSMTVAKGDNNFQLMCSMMMGWEQEIHVEKGDTGYSESSFLTDFFRAAKTAKNEQFLLRIQDSYDKWVMGEETDKAVIIEKLCKLYRNYVADKTWNTTSNRDAKIIALSTRIDEGKKQLAKVTDKLKKVSFDSEKGKPKTFYKGSAKAGDLWKFKWEGPDTKCPTTGASYKWCKHHGDGMYMPAYHNHDEWAKNKAAKRAGTSDTSYRRDKRARDTNDSGGGPAQKKGSGPSKMVLNDRIRTSLVTQFGMTVDDANNVFNNAYKEGDSSKD